MRCETKLDTRLPSLMSQKASVGRLERRVKLQEPAPVAFVKASWDTDKTARCTEKRQGPRGDFDEAEINGLSLPFCLLNCSLGGLIGIDARTQSRPKKGTTYPDER